MSHIHNPILEVENLSVSFRMYKRGTSREDLRVISDLSVMVGHGEILAIAGSSGSGKSLLAHAVMGILPSNAHVNGFLRYEGRTLTPELQRELRGRDMALIPQSVTYLDPLMKVGAQVRGVAGKAATEPQQAVFARLGLSQTVEKMYPYQLSGGMARRVLFSTAMVSGAKLVIADEPTPGMHLEQAVEALRSLRELANEGKGVVLITHDINLALGVADRIAVFYAGTTVEEAAVADFAAGQAALRHPYSKALWRAMPQNGFQPLAGFQPYAKDLPGGCLFAPRCPMRTAECDAAPPPVRDLRDGHVRCYHAT